MPAGRPPDAPGGRPLVGHTPGFLRDPLGALERWGAVDAPVVRARVGTVDVRLVTTPAAARQVLVGDAAQYRKAEVVSDRLGTLQGGSLVLLEGEAWADRRGTLESTLTRDRMATAASVTSRYAREAVADWPAGRPFRVGEAAADLSLAILARALFGLDLRGERTAVHEAAEAVLARLDLRSPSAYLPEWVPTPTNRRFRRAVADLHDRLDERVDRRATAEGTGEDLLSTMLAAGLPREVVRDELVAFLFAGFDSTATALSCTLGLLAEHQSVQADLHAELDAELDGRPPESADLGDLDLLDAVVRESLRRYPPQYVLFREPTEPVELAGYRCDPGEVVVVSPWLLHRDPAHWGDPEEFRPGRWLDGGDGEAGGERRGIRGEAERPAFAYLPYGGGPRRCLGQRLADLTLRLVVATVCRRRRLEPAGSFTVGAGATLTLDGGLSLVARERG